ncbi:MAG: hypothetical protein LBC74_00255 [Planctomycetaceae bacterium]|jgi:hypothetical protein|nr:hypothetical protein [Planctomycetaceae bacterium]
MEDYQRYGTDLESTARFGFDEIVQNSQRINRIFFLPIILVSGLTTTALAVLAVFLINFYTGHNLFAFLISFVIPVGAIGCGIVAGIGYAVSSRILQFFPNNKFIVFICILQVFVFIASRYSEYTIERKMMLNVIDKMANDSIIKGEKKVTITNAAGEKVEIDTDKFIKHAKETIPSFITFYRNLVEETEWSSIKKQEKDASFKLGKWGWLIEILTALAFAICSNVPLFMLASTAYCKQCSRFMRKQIDFKFPARAPIQKIKKNDAEAAEAFSEEDEKRLVYATLQISEIEDFLRSNIPIKREELANFLSDKQNKIKTETANIKGQIPNAVQIIYSECPDCDNFLLLVKMEFDPNTANALPPAEFLRFYNGIFVTEFTKNTNKTDM